MTHARTPPALPPVERSRALAVALALGLAIATSPRPAHGMPAPGDSGPTDPAVVESTGAARYRIPIATPPGPGGFAPNLELVYSSRSGDGPFGVGWTIGIPEIRCSARFGVPDFANCAEYELGDVLLVQKPGANTYHTFVESFQRITYAGGSWTVEQPNGTKLIFGEAASHRISQGGATARWLLERMEDAFGNQIFLEYLLTDVGSAYPASIFYGADATDTGGSREIRFVYEARPDERLLFHAGIKRFLTRRVREIQVFGHDQIAHRYLLKYALPGVTYSTHRSRLASVQEFGTDCANPAADPEQASCVGLPLVPMRRETPARSHLL